MKSQQLPLQGKVAIVTGASRGIGCGIAQRLGSAGATVVVAARTFEDDGYADKKGSATQTASLINNRGGTAFPMTLDLESPESREALITTTISRHGKVDILVNNAGTAVYTMTDAMPIATARSQTDAYFLGPWHLCSLVLPHMKARGEGKILNIGSCTAAAPEPPLQGYYAARGNETLYGALKAAMHRFSLGLAAELSAYNIAVNVLAPVLAVYTPGLASLNLGITADHAMCEPVEDISEAAVAMLSQISREYTGQVEFSYQMLDRIARPSMSLDGITVVRSRGAPNLV